MSAGNQRVLAAAATQGGGAEPVRAPIDERGVKLKLLRKIDELAKQQPAVNDYTWSEMGDWSVDRRSRRLPHR